jgi:DNA (cytosine-5)-methyltransferase 1
MRQCDVSATKGVDIIIAGVTMAASLGAKRRIRRTTEWAFAEFFAGIGLMRMGLEASDPRWNCAFSNDLDETKRRIYSAHFGCPVSEVNGSDVHDLPGSVVPNVVLATASFPCTDLSVAGRQEGIRSGESSAFWGFHRVLQEMGEARRPPIVLLENVLGFLGSNGGRDFRDAMRSLNALGYRVDPFVLDARWFVPQSRARLFVVGVRDDLGRGSTHAVASRIRPDKLVKFISDHPEIAWSIRDLPDPPRTSRTSLRDVVRDPPKSHKDWWSRERVDYLYDQMFPRHQLWVDEHREARIFHYATAFRRVRPQNDGSKRSMAELRLDGIAGCLRTPKGGSGRQILVRVGRGRLDVRLLSAAECAALMGADGYRMDASLNEALFGFGDAVCVDKVTWIAKHYLEPVLSDEHSAISRPAASQAHK